MGAERAVGRPHAQVNASRSGRRFGASHHKGSRGVPWTRGCSESSLTGDPFRGARPRRPRSMRSAPSPCDGHAVVFVDSESITTANDRSSCGSALRPAGELLAEKLAPVGDCADCGQQGRGTASEASTFTLWWCRPARSEQLRNCRQRHCSCGRATPVRAPKARGDSARPRNVGAWRVGS
jgi:hypothetical protein